MLVIDTISETRAKIHEYKTKGLSIGFVPTMGALHAGHESLIEKAEKDCDIVVISIFVNPLQFGPNEDFEKYPRELQKDKNICSSHNVGFIFSPKTQEMYPDANTKPCNSLTIVKTPQKLQDKLCGKSRPGHFDGVTTVVTKLLNIIQPDKAYFGQKDAQQLLIIKKMVKDLNMPVEIISCPIIRDKDGLALSSRNKYLSSEERKKALSINILLKEVKKHYDNGEKSVDKIFKNVLVNFPKEIKIDYLEALDCNSLENVNNLKEGTLIAIAAIVGHTRLIDNIIL